MKNATDGALGAIQHKKNQSHQIGRRVRVPNAPFHFAQNNGVSDAGQGGTK
jgi:hypothetical protein